VEISRKSTAALWRFRDTVDSFRAVRLNFGIPVLLRVIGLRRLRSIKDEVVELLSGA
jgi:hypothetical protein